MTAQKQRGGAAPIDERPLPSPDSTVFHEPVEQIRFAYSRGTSKFDNRPQQRTAESFDAFADAVLADRSAEKGGIYICAPMQEGMHNDVHKYPDLATWRQKHLAARRAWQPFDVDKLTPAAFGLLLAALERWQGFAYTTASHTPAAPRLRFVLAASRPLTYSESEAIGRAVQAMLCAEIGEGEIKFDESVYRGEQPCYTPVGTFEAFRFNGAPLDADELLKSAPPPARPQRTYTPADGTLPTDSIADYLRANWTVHGIDRSGRVDIECPFADGHSTDSSESSTSYFPAGARGADKGFFRCLHTSCAGRKDADFLEKIGWMEAGFEEVACSEAELLPAVPVLPANDRGQIEPTKSNLKTALSHPELCGARLRLDTFTDDIAVHFDGEQERPIKDTDITRLALRLEEVHGFKDIPKERMRDMLALVADYAQFDSAQEWLTGLEWDSVPRIGAFLPRYLKTDDTPYTRAVGRYIWSALAGRVLVPGVKADMVPIMSSTQGQSKSSICEAIAPAEKYFGELDLASDKDEVARAVRGKLVIELPELTGIKKQDVEHLKALVTRRFEEWTPKYKEFKTRYGRRCIFFGTTNEDTPLPEDQSGHRRWLPFRVGKCDDGAIVRDRDQLWAEGAAVFTADGVQWQDAERLAREVHPDFETDDPQLAIVYEWLRACDFDGTPNAEGWRSPVTTHEVAMGALHLHPSQVTPAVGKRIAGYLRKLGYVDANAGKRVTVGGVKTTRFVRGE